MPARGFTLVELITGLAMLAVLSLLAVPGFGGYLRDCHRAATVNALVHAIRSARVLAGATGVPVELCATRDRNHCSDAEDWTGDLLLQQQPGADMTAGGTPLRIVPLAHARSSLTIHSNRPAIRFSPLLPAATTATITVCDDRGPQAAAAVIVSRSGRPRVSNRNASGGLLQCP